MYWTPAISLVSVLIGAGISWFSTQYAAGRNRTDDRRKREIDRVIEALPALEEAQARYAEDIRDSERAAKLRIADRRMAFAVGLISHAQLRSHAQKYVAMLQTHYLWVDASPEDIADEGVSVPSLADLDAAHKQLVKELRDYASK